MKDKLRLDYAVDTDDVDENQAVAFVQRAFNSAHDVLEDPRLTSLRFEAPNDYTTWDEDDQGWEIVAEFEDRGE